MRSLEIWKLLYYLLEKVASVYLSMAIIELFELP